MTTDIAIFSFAAFTALRAPSAYEQVHRLTAALPQPEVPLTSLAARLAPHSLTYQEIPDTATFNAVAARLYHLADVMLTGLPEDTVRTTLRYTQAPVLGYIYEALSEFEAAELREAIPLIDEWQFPKEWLTPIREQLAYLDFVATGTLAECLADKAWEIAIQLMESFACSSSGHITDNIGRFPATTLVFSRTTNLFVERALGRAAMPSRSTSVTEWSRLFALPENAARGGLLDLLQHYVSAGLHFDHVACRGAAYEGFYNQNTSGSIVGSRTPSRFVFDTEEALTSPHYRVLQWLATQGVEVDDSDGVLGLSLADRRVTSMALYGRDDLVDDAAVEAASTDVGDEEDMYDPLDDGFDY